jgi:hypothetical protein
MLLVGYFEGLESERGIAWRCADSLSLRQFLKLGMREAVPDHSTLSRTRARLPLEFHEAVFTLVLRLVAARGLVKGRRVGVDASTMEANAAMRSIVRRADGAGWQAMLGALARTRRACRRRDWRGPRGSHRHLVPADQQLPLHRSLPTERHTPLPTHRHSTNGSQPADFINGPLGPIH